MKFKDEYKKELNKISPTEEQCERIRSGVAKKIAESAPVKKKKPLYLRIAAVSGASICAAAVLIVVIFGMNGGKHFSGINMTPSANEGINAAGSYTDTGGADQNLPPKSEDNLQNSFGSASVSTASVQSDPSSAGTSSGLSEPAPADGGEDNPGSADSGEPITGGGPEPPPGEPAPAGGGEDNPGGGIPSNPGEPAPTGGGGDEPGIGGEGVEIPDGFVYLAFSEDNSICEVTVNEATRSYRLDKDTSAPPLSDDMAFGAVTNNGLDVLAQFDEDMMFIYSTDGRIYNVYRFII